MYLIAKTLLRKLQNAVIRRGEIIQRPGDLNSKIYKVKSGLLRSYIIDSKGKEHIFMFGPEKWIVADSNPPDVPCDLYIDALEDSAVTVYEKEIASDQTDVMKLIKRMEVLQKRILMLLGSPAIVRYEHFIDTYPDIVQRVPQRMIASYLGITPEALSKVKGNWLKA